MQKKADVDGTPINYDFFNLQKVGSDPKLAEAALETIRDRFGIVAVVEAIYTGLPLNIGLALRKEYSTDQAVNPVIVSEIKQSLLPTLAKESPELYNNINLLLGGNILLYAVNLAKYVEVEKTDDNSSEYPYTGYFNFDDFELSDKLKKELKEFGIEPDVSIFDELPPIPLPKEVKTTSSYPDNLTIDATVNLVQKHRKFTAKTHIEESKELRKTYDKLNNENK